MRCRTLLYCKIVKESATREHRNNIRTDFGSKTHTDNINPMITLSFLTSVVLEASAMLPSVPRPLELSPTLQSFLPHLQYQPARLVMSPKTLELSLEPIP
jgi:hypothetical protein